ncbi:MAG TPA: type 1 glutamine amidotransferase [Allosphingosinicella sp.]|nr:type 1 glutamine amidotransferase [Allosphingosinicella sp.]
MKVGILETGAPPGPLEARFGAYPAMMSAMLGPAFETASYDVAAGSLPAAPDAHTAYLITGSPAGVYEDHTWIPPLTAFLREAKGKAKLVGICFGHQIMAEAFGGRVEKSDRGWGVGLQSYDVAERAPWMDDVRSFAIPVSHQDQIVEQPPASRVLAANGFSPFGLLAYDDQPAISFQGHPEFDPEFARALIEIRRDRLPRVDDALASLDRPNDRARVGEWIRRFLRG